MKKSVIGEKHLALFARSMRLRLRGPRVSSSARIRHRNALTEKAWEVAVQRHQELLDSLGGLYLKSLSHADY